jgi:hypothetical protein
MRFLFRAPAASESSGIYLIRAGSFSGLAARLG